MTMLCFRQNSKLYIHGLLLTADALHLEISSHKSIAAVSYGKNFPTCTANLLKMLYRLKWEILFAIQQML